MKENQSNTDHRIFQQDREFNEYLRELYPADNELGFDPSKLVITDKEKQELIDRREKSDLEMEKAGIILPPRPRRRILREPTQTLAEHIKEEFKRKKGDRVGEEISVDEMQNPNSFFHVSLDPENKDMWIGVRTALLPNGVIVDDAKWVHSEKQVVLDWIEGAKPMTGMVAYHIYGPADDIGVRKFEVVRFDETTERKEA